MGQGFAGTPAFTLFRRGLVTQAVQRFRGLNAFRALTELGPDWAQDLLNVIVSGAGYLSKMRLPITLSPDKGFRRGPDSFWPFQQSNGTRQVLVQFGESLYHFDNDLTAATLIETSPLDIGPWSFTKANNMLFGANGQRMMKWTGANWQPWGGTGPTLPPSPPAPALGNLSPAFGYIWAYAWKNSVTSHVTNISPLGPTSGSVNNTQFVLKAAALGDILRGR